MSDTVNVPIRDSVGAALRFSREHWRFIFAVAGGGAGVSGALAALELGAPFLGLLVMIATTLVQAIVYGLLIARVLGAGAQDWLQQGLRVWAALAVVGFFLFIVFFVLSIPTSIALAVGPLAPYASDLQAAGDDQAAVMSVMMRFMEEQTGAIVVVFLLYAAIWLALTSRLYLAAPATRDQGRILTFETWAWTKGQTLRIAAARLMLLGPAYVLVSALSLAAGRLLGFDLLDPGAINAAARVNPIGFVVFAAAQTFVTLALYSALEAGLSTYLYRGLKRGATPD